MAYTKEDVDRAYAAGVQAAEKLWQSYLLNMLDEGAIMVEALECQKCGTRYRFNPAVTYPTPIVCPHCVKYQHDTLGLCAKVSRRVAVTRYQVGKVQNAVASVLTPLTTFRELFRTAGTARTLTMQEATQLPVYQRLMTAVDELSNLIDSGWDSRQAINTLEPSCVPVTSVALERYDATTI